MNKLVLILIAIFLPPVAVVLKRGFGMDLLINILLCLLVFFPGMVHALWVVSKVDAPEGRTRGRVTGALRSV